jgi:HlyD family secretion protein
MKRRWIVVAVITICLGVAVFGVLRSRISPDEAATGYITAAVERGEIVNTITSTGTIEPVSTVNVGTQVSGIINKVYVDFNDTVTKGQLIAELDRTLLSGALDEAAAARNRAKAQYDQALAEYQRNEPLFKKGFVAEQDLSQLHATLLMQEATLQSADATVKKARINLQYATITSPITGTVIQRNIEAGQTVASNFSAPTLFVIAENLRRMQILASVDEADIGAIRKGQEVTYTVQAYADKKFAGTVEQVRLQPTVAQNVVTYTVVITTENSDGTLLPGMTATIDFIVEKATDVLMIPSAALRFRPAGDSGMQMRRHGADGVHSRPAWGSGPPMSPLQGGAEGAMSSKRQWGDSSRAGGAARPGRMPGDSSMVRRGVVWIASPDSLPQLIPVRIGITDGKMTEVHSKADLSEGMMVITGVKTTPKKKTKSVSLLPQPGRPPGGGGRP